MLPDATACHPDKVQIPVGHRMKDGLHSGDLGLHYGFFQEASDGGCHGARAGCDCGDHSPERAPGEPFVCLGEIPLS